MSNPRDCGSRITSADSALPGVGRGANRLVSFVMPARGDKYGGRAKQGVSRPLQATMAITAQGVEDATARSPGDRAG